MSVLNLYGRFLYATAEQSGGGAAAAVVVVKSPDAPADATATAEPAPEGMRNLDVAAGGDAVPLGPLGGPELKTREEMVVETNEAIIEQAEAEIAAVETPPETPPPDTTQGGLVGSGPLT